MSWDFCVPHKNSFIIAFHGSNRFGFEIQADAEK